MSRCSTVAGGVLASLWLGGCCTYPCDTDVTMCKEGSAIKVDRSCQPTEPLTVELDEMDTLDEVSPDAWPVVHHGPQGGIHFALALRLHGLDPAHEQVQVSLDAAECEDAECADPSIVAKRTFNADESLLDTEDGAWILSDVVLLLDREPSGAGEVQLDVLDGCGRNEHVVHQVAE